MNNRQMALISLLEANRDKFLTKKDIYTQIPFAYPRHLENHNNEGNKSVALRNISLDVREINNNDDIDFIIIYKKGYKIATPDEAEDYIKRRFKRDLKSLKLNWKLVNKMKLNNQLYMEEDDIKEIKTFANNI